MAKTVVRGTYYDFDRSRAHREVGEAVAEAVAQLRVKSGGDVYTLFKEDAYRLASSVYSGRAVMEAPHQPGHFSHYHPGGVHPEYQAGHPKARKTPGHVFFGDRDEKWSSGLAGSSFRRG